MWTWCMRCQSWAIKGVGSSGRHFIIHILTVFLKKGVHYRHLRYLYFFFERKEYSKIKSVKMKLTIYNMKYSIDKIYFSSHSWKWKRDIDLNLSKYNM